MCFQDASSIHLESGIGLTYKAVRSQISITSPMDGEVEAMSSKCATLMRADYHCAWCYSRKADVITREARARYWTREKRSTGQERQKAERRTANQARQCRDNVGARQDVPSASSSSMSWNCQNPPVARFALDGSCRRGRHKLSAVLHDCRYELSATALPPSKHECTRIQWSKMLLRASRRRNHKDALVYYYFKG